MYNWFTNTWDETDELELVPDVEIEEADLHDGQLVERRKHRREAAAIAAWRKRYGDTEIPF